MARNKAVPDTEIRNLYRLIRGSREFVQDPLADIFAASCGTAGSFLSGLFCRSVQQFSTYKSHEGIPFRPEGRPKIQERWHKNKGKEFAKRLAYLMAGGKTSGNFPYAYIDDELSFRRTPGAGAPKSGQGGVDVLLCSQDAVRLPVIGEIKAASDPSTPFAGLVQALTYASELVTDSQCHRLVQAYPNRFFCAGNIPEGPRVEILLIIEQREEKNAKEIQRLDCAYSLVKTLMKEKAFSERIRSIACLSAAIPKEAAEFIEIFRFGAVQ